MAELGLDGSGFASGLHKAQGLAEGAAHSIGAAVIGLVGIGTVTMALQKTIETMGGLVNASQGLGIGVEQVQLLRRAAQDAGTDLERVGKAFEKIDVARQKALTPGLEGQGLRQAFAGLGIGPEQLRSMTAGQLFMGPMAQTARNGNQENVSTLLHGLGLKETTQIVGVLRTNFAELAATMKKYAPSWTARQRLN